MEISQLLAAQGTSSSAQPGKGESGNGTEFASMLKQAGGNASDAGEAQSMAATQPAGGRKGPQSGGEPGREGALPDGLETGANQPLTDTLASAMPVELAPLAQQIGQALENEGLAAQAMTAPEFLEQSLSQAGDDASLALASLPLSVAGAQDLSAIRQRLDMIASAQRGETALSAQAQGALLANADLMRSKDVKAGIAHQAMAQSEAAAAGLRHQQLTAQGMQAIAQQSALQNAATTQGANAQPTGFAEAIAAMTGDEAPLSGRGGAESHSGQILTAMSGPAGNAASNMSGQPSATGMMTQTLNAPLASAQWQQGLGQQLVALHQRGGQQVELHLHPAELGPLSVSLKVDDQLAQAQFFSTNPQVRAAVEQAIPQLRQALEETGIQLGEAMVGEHRQQHDGDGQPQDNGALASHPGSSGNAQAEDGVAATAPHELASGGNGIDLYA